MPMVCGIAGLVVGVGDSASQLIYRAYTFLNTQLVMSRLWKTTRAEENPTRPIPIKTKVSFQGTLWLRAMANGSK